MLTSSVNDHQVSFHGSHESVAESDKTMTILQLGSASMLRLSLTVNSWKTVAVVDTAAEATIISDKVYQSLTIKTPIRRHAFMHGAGRDMKMETYVIGPVNIKIGSCNYPSEIYVAQIDDEVLLGLDFLHRNNVVNNCSNNQFSINSVVLQMSYGESRELPTIAQVTVPGKAAIPPNSAIHVDW